MSIAPTQTRLARLLGLVRDAADFEMVVNWINKRVRKLPEWPAYIIGFVPVVWLVWQGSIGGLGVDPVKALEHELGLIALQLLIASLMVTPLKRYAGINILKFRRALGLLGFAYVALHLMTWLLLDMALYWSQIVNDIVERPYITIGMAAFLLLIPLAVTSTKGWIRRLGQRWFKLHRLVYLAVPLGGLHFVMQEKVWTLEAIIYLVLAIGIVAIRVLWMKRKTAAG